MQQELVKRKKVGGRSNKKKWKRASDTQGLQLNDLQEAKNMVSEKTLSSSKTKRTGPSFKIEILPDAAIQKKLESDRFKRKEYESVSKTEEKLLKRKERAIEVEAPKKEKQVDIDVEPAFDIWEEDMNIGFKKPVIKTIKEVEMPKILKPHAGQSYNPSMQDQTDLMKIIV